MLLPKTLLHCFAGMHSIEFSFFVGVENAVRNFVQIYGELCEIGLVGREKYANCPKKCVEMNIAMSYVL